MADKKVEFHIDTSANTQGVEAASASFDQLDQNLDQIVSEMQRLGTEFEQAVSEGDAEAAKERFVRLKIEAEKLKEVMVELGDEGAEGLGEMIDKLEEAEEQIEGLAQEAKQADDAAQEFVEAASAASREAAEQADATLRAADAAVEYERSVERRADLEKAWADQMGRSNSALDLQQRKLEQQASATREYITAKAELLKAQIDNNETDPAVAAEQKALIDEMLQRRLAGIDQALAESTLKINEKRRGVLGRADDQKLAELNRASGLDGLILGDEDRAAKEARLAELNAEVSRTNAELVKAEEALSSARRNNDRREAAEALRAAQKAAEAAQANRGSTEARTIENQLERDTAARGDFANRSEYENYVEKLRSDIAAGRAELQQLRDEAGLQESQLTSNQIVEEIRQQTASEREKTRRRGVVQLELNTARSKRDGLGNEISGKAEAVEVGNKAGQKIVDEIAKAFEDGAVSAAEQPALSAAVSKLMGSSAARDDAALQMLQSLIRQWQNTEKKLQSLELKVKNSR
ncbi:hypothetical protein ACFPK9_01290 [Rubritalea spongiae]|uniref:Chromosome partition protein Smc n=1 Tax=Rubritalea spongiae TaxID=430797 RepID=A0ABW5E251_9BACT